MPMLLLALGVTGALLALNALHPPRHHRWSLPAFLAGWLTSELPVHHLVVQAGLLGFLVWQGALDSLAGWIGLVLAVSSWAGLLLLLRRGHRADEVIEAALVEGLGPDYAGRLAADLGTGPDPGMPWRKLLVPFNARDPRVEKIRNVPFSRPRRASRRKLKLDIYRPRRREGRRPVLLYLHGGAWVLGDKREQGVPMMLHLAAQGWICVTANYRLSPRATFPDQVVDVKRAIRWIRDHIADYGGDPDFLVISGGSAGGHLAALAALTPGDPEYQPGFEDSDTSVEACVPFYGVYDFTNREGLSHGGMRRLLERYVMKARFAREPERFDRASPMSRVGDHCVPFMVVHGTNDTLVPVAEARHFVQLLRAGSRRPVVYAELPGAQHAFEVLPSLRTVHVVRGVERFLSVIYGDWQRERGRSSHLAS
jgi:acetyl esterase/lipase